MFESKPECRRKVEKSRLKWLEDVENASRELKVKRWSQKSSNREQWASVVTEVKVLSGQGVSK
jgi:hypothetical protein